MASARAGAVAAGDAAAPGGSVRAGFGGGRAGSGSVGAPPSTLGSAARCDQPEDGTGFETGSVDESAAGPNFAVVLEASGSALVAGAFDTGGSDGMRGAGCAAGDCVFAAVASVFAAGPSGLVAPR
jgi:hypothetical protein